MEMLKRSFSSWTSRGAAALLLAVAQAALAVPAARFDAAFEVFSQARAGDASATEKAADAFAALRKAEPINPVVMAYAGAATAMRANTTWFPWKKMGFAEDGLALLDKSLAMLTAAHNAPLQHEVPAALEVRFVAANTFLAVPGFMNRGPRGAKLLQAVLDSPLLATSPLAFRVAVWMAAAKEAARDKRPDDARRYLNEVVKANGPQLDAARAQLQALSSS
jgi:hypothetical protein